MQIILSEWKRSWKSLLVWSAAFALLIMGAWVNTLPVLVLRNKALRS